MISGPVSWSFTTAAGLASASAAAPALSTDGVGASAIVLLSNYSAGTTSVATASATNGADGGIARSLDDEPMSALSTSMFDGPTQDGPTSKHRAP
jgi:hypothetical protein